jgi:hypothetical protein
LVASATGIHSLRDLGRLLRHTHDVFDDILCDRSAIWQMTRFINNALRYLRVVYLRPRSNFANYHYSAVTTNTFYRDAAK